MQTDTTLDPADWEEVRRVFHAAVDSCLDQMAAVRERPVWQPVPESVKTALREPAPNEGAAIADLLTVFERSMQPYATGNTHPRFFGWVHGSGNVAGVLGEMLAAFMNSNTGGRDHAAVYVERQVIDWCRSWFGFPEGSSGIVTTGTSMGTVIAAAVARNEQAEGDIRLHGVGASPRRLIGYASREAHCCLAKSFELLGLGAEALRRVEVDAEGRMEIGALARMIEADLAAGLQPFMVFATAGTVNTGAIDDMEAIADICRCHALWMHVDGAFGALAILAPEHADRLSGISRADSLAFDFHKWLHVPYDAGCVLVRNEPAHRRTFSSRVEYLSGLEQGLAGGNPWFCEYGPELSRGFRALKVWFTIQALGTGRLGFQIQQNCRQAQYLQRLIRGESRLEMLAPVALNIVCFRFIDCDLTESELDALNARIVCDLQLRGIAAPSTTRIDGRLAIRVALTNHRTRDCDLELLVDAVCRMGAEAQDLELNRSADASVTERTEKIHRTGERNAA